MENTNEIWVEMWDFPNYEVSNMGNIRNARTEKKLKVRQDGKEYRMVTIWYNGKKYTKRVGRYVWMSFNKQFCSKTIDHINFNAGDDRLENLQCITMQENLDKRRYSKLPKGSKYGITNEQRGKFYMDYLEGRETTWTIMKKTGIPLNYLNTAFRRKSWRRYLPEGYEIPSCN